MPGLVGLRASCSETHYQLSDRSFAGQYSLPVARLASFVFGDERYLISHIGGSICTMQRNVILPVIESAPEGDVKTRTYGVSRASVFPQSSAQNEDPGNVESDLTGPVAERKSLGLSHTPPLSSHEVRHPPSVIYWPPNQRIWLRKFFFW